MLKYYCTCLCFSINAFSILQFWICIWYFQLKCLDDKDQIYGFSWYLFVTVAASWPYFQVSFMVLLLCLFSILKFMPQSIQVFSLDPVSMVCVLVWFKVTCNCTTAYWDVKKGYILIFFAIHYRNWLLLCPLQWDFPHKHSVFFSLLCSHEEQASDLSQNHLTW